MQRIDLPERPNWKESAKKDGFHFHSMHGAPYWDETSAYRFTAAEIENLICQPATELHAMCREAAARIAGSEKLMDRLCIPAPHRDFVARSLRDDEPEIFGRFDFIHNGNGPAKMIEYNADTPGALFESSTFQHQWLEEQIDAGHLPQDASQLNAIHQALVARFSEIFSPRTDIHFTSLGGHEENPEDYLVTERLTWAAREAGMTPHYTELEDIGLTTAGQFADAEDRVIRSLFKLYPWEDMLRDEFGAYLATAECRFLEPPWKALLSNKGILPVLWEMFEGHPNLLPAFFAEDVAAGAPIVARSEEALEQGHVAKPIFSRQGSTVEIVENGMLAEQSADQDFDEHPKILQAYHPAPVMGGFRPVLGAWIIGRTCAGLGILEDRGRITQHLSRFKPHFVLD